MKKRTLAYLKYIDNLITMYQDNPEEAHESLDEAIQKHQIQIAFFSHERIVHLIVTVTFAILTMLSLMLTLLSSEITILLLTIGFIVLLIPYIKHYYLLENSVQRMYEQYDELCKIKDSSSFTFSIEHVKYLNTNIYSDQHK